MNSKTHRIIFWTTTTILSLMMLFSAFSYITNPDVKSGFVHLGFPDYFRIELAVLKTLGAIALIVPAIPAGIKYLAYFGFALTFLSAAIAHISIDGQLSSAVMPLVFLGILSVSYTFYQKLQLRQAYPNPDQSFVAR